MGFISRLFKAETGTDTVIKNISGRLRRMFSDESMKIVSVHFHQDIPSDVSFEDNIFNYNAELLCLYLSAILRLCGYAPARLRGRLSAELVDDGIKQYLCATSRYNEQLLSASKKFFWERHASYSQCEYVGGEKGHFDPNSLIGIFQRNTRRWVTDPNEMLVVSTDLSHTLASFTKEFTPYFKKMK